MNPRHILTVVSSVTALLLSACQLDPPATQAARSPGVSSTHACPPGSNVNVIGDSITVYAAATLADHLQTAGYVPAINARSEREIGEGLETIRGYVPLSAPRCWVVALGTNDVYRVDSSGWQASINAVVDLIPPEEPHWWVRVTAPAAPQSDQKFDDLVPYPMIQWRPIPEELKDGVHPNEAGVEMWVSLVMAALTSGDEG